MLSFKPTATFSHSRTQMCFKRILLQGFTPHFKGGQRCPVSWDVPKSLKIMPNCCTDSFIIIKLQLIINNNWEFYNYILPFNRFLLCFLWEATHKTVDQITFFEILQGKFDTEDAISLNSKNTFLKSDKLKMGSSIRTQQPCKRIHSS